MTDSIFSIKLSKYVSISWDNRSQSIVKDYLFNDIAQSFPMQQQEIVNLILNKDATPARVCGINRNLSKGDLAFLLIDEVKDIPYAEALGIQWDYFDSNCKHPAGMLDYINNHRLEVKTKVETYLLLAN